MTSKAISLLLFCHEFLNDLSGRQQSEASLLLQTHGGASASAVTQDSKTFVPVERIVQV